MAPRMFGEYLKAAKGVTVLDGGTGSEISKRLPKDKLDFHAWTSAVHMAHPEVVESVHKDYLQAGAQIIITNTYACNRHCLRGDQKSHLMEEANAVACRVAHQARSKVGKEDDLRCFVCGSISAHPPEFGTAVTKSNSKRDLELDDSETPPGVVVEDEVEKSNPTAQSWWPPEAEEFKNFKDQADALKAGGVDCIALEMIKDLHHGPLILRAAATTGLPVLLGITIVKDDEGRLFLRDDRTKALPEQLKDLLAACPNVVCVNVMHSPPEWCAEALVEVRKAWNGVLGCYPNNGDSSTWPEWNEGDVTPERFVALSREWRKQGATLIGGCCGIGVDHIRALARDVSLTQGEQTSKM